MTIKACAHCSVSFDDGGEPWKKFCGIPCLKAARPQGNGGAPAPARATAPPQPATDRDKSILLQSTFRSICELYHLEYIPDSPVGPAHWAAAEAMRITDNLLRYLSGEYVPPQGTQAPVGMAEEEVHKDIPF